MPRAAQFLPDAAALATERGGSEVCQCSGCGLVQLSNDPSLTIEGRQGLRFSERWGFSKEQFEDFTRRFSLKNKKVIEIGCGRGNT